MEAEIAGRHRYRERLGREIADTLNLIQDAAPEFLLKQITELVKAG